MELLTIVQLNHLYYVSKMEFAKSIDISNATRYIMHMSYDGLWKMLSNLYGENERN